MGRLKDKPSNIVYDFYGVNQNGDESPLNFLGGGLLGAGRLGAGYMAGLNKNQRDPNTSTNSGNVFGDSASRIPRYRRDAGDQTDAMTAREDYDSGSKQQSMMALANAATAGGGTNSAASSFAEAIQGQQLGNVPLSGHSSSQMNKPVEESTQPIVGTGGVTAAVNIPVPEVIPEQGGGGGTGPGGTKKRYILTEE